MKEKVALIPLYLCILAGLYASWQIFGVGLGLTNLNNQFVFGFWIILDLSLIALGSGAFCVGFLYYILGWKELASLLPLSVALGLVCYASAGYILLLEIGQPLRFWFPFRHPNFTSMLTEITFCITLYTAVLILEFTPKLLGHKGLAHNQMAKSASKRLLLAMPIIVILGAILSLLHQGSLGGVYGVLFARPFAWRPGVYIWPWTFILFITSAISAGPLFTLLTAKIMEKLSSRKLIALEVQKSIARFCAIFLGVNLLLRLADLLAWKYWLLPKTGYPLSSMFHGLAFGKWLMYMETLPFTLLPLLILAVPRLRKVEPLYLMAGMLACAGLITNRYIMNLQTLAVPTLPFEAWESYAPNWLELAPGFMALPFIILVLRFLFKQGLLFKDANCSTKSQRNCSSH